MLFEISPDKFDEYLNKPCIVDFYSTTCPACVQYAPIFENAGNRNENLTFLKINIDNDYSLAQRYGIEYIPTTIKFVNGEPVSKAVGCISQEELEKMADAT